MTKLNESGKLGALYVVLHFFQSLRYPLPFLPLRPRLVVLEAAFKEDFVVVFKMREGFHEVRHVFDGGEMPAEDEWNILVQHASVGEIR